jgi:hypothetical protein
MTDMLQHVRHPLPNASERLTIDGTVRQLTVPAGAYQGRVHMIGGPAMYTIDGQTPPSASRGNPIYDNEEKMFNLAELINSKWVRQGAVNGAIEATYYIRN